MDRINSPIRCSLDALEARTLLSLGPTHVPTPPYDNREELHVQLARRLVREVTMENNLYATPTAITWKGLDGATISTNTSVCSTLVTKLLKYAYGFTNAQFTQWTGETSPEAEDYFDAAFTDNGFTRVANINDIRIGDLFIAKYLEPVGTATGHVALISGPATLISSTAVERRYALPVIDSSSSYHGTADTRYRIDPTTGDYDDGIGAGTMRMITDPSGILIKYSWSTSSGSTIYDASTRPSLFARVPPHTGMPGRLTTGGSGHVPAATVTTAVKSSFFSSGTPIGADRAADLAELA